MCINLSPYFYTHFFIGQYAESLSHFPNPQDLLAVAPFILIPNHNTTWAYNMANKAEIWEDSPNVLQVAIHCPGCKCSHVFTMCHPNKDGAQWTWNGSLTSPTFSPSLLCNKDHPESRCHSFVKEGTIQFLSDCFHELANKTVPLPDYD